MLMDDSVFTPLIVPNGERGLRSILIPKKNKEKEKHDDKPESGNHSQASSKNIYNPRTYERVRS